MLNITQAYQVALISSSHTSEEDARRFMIASNELDWVSQIEYGCIVHAGLQDDDWKVDMVYPKARLLTFRKYLM